MIDPDNLIQLKVIVTQNTDSDTEKILELDPNRIVGILNLPNDKQDRAIVYTDIHDHPAFSVSESIDDIKVKLRDLREKL